MAIYRSALLCLLLLTTSVTCQQIWDVWQTTWNQSKQLVRRANSDGLPLNFTSLTTSQADIVIQDDEVFQSMIGFGGSLTDSSAQLLSQLKIDNATNYWKLLNHIFDPSYNTTGAGMSVLRLAIGASDFSSKVYSLTGGSEATGLKSFTIDPVPLNIWETLADIKTIAPRLQIIATPWSMPASMKTSDTMLGGSFNPNNVSDMANYLLQAVQAFDAKGFRLFAVGIQNEPKNNNPTYPTALLPAITEAKIAIELRNMLDNNSFSDIRILAYEHNWDDVDYPTQLLQQAGAAIDGISFHCYAGSVKNQSSLNNLFPQKEIFHTECTSALNTDPWENMKWHMDNLFIGVPENFGKSALMWNLVLDEQGGPILQGSNSCGGGCKGVVTINPNGTYTLNEEFYAIAHASRAVIPKDPDGPYGQRIGLTVTNQGLRVGGYKTGRTRSTDPARYSLVVLNWQDNKVGNTVNPQSIDAIIQFRDQQINFTFPLGVTTLWWYR